jgi:hypothetical protein
MTTNGRELLFITANVTDSATLLAALRPGVSAHRLLAGHDGLEQMAEVLAHHSGLSALHIVSHGAPGRLDLGAAELNSDNIRFYRDTLKIIGNALSEGGDVMLYGCEVGAGVAGRRFLAQLADAVGADVAASSAITGAAALGGHWSLDRQAGVVQTQLAFVPRQLQAYAGTLTISDPVRPTATVSMSDSALKIGDSSTLTITFSVPVNWTGTYDALSTPSLEQSGFMFRSNGGITWTGTFMPLASYTDTDNVISLNLSGFTSTATGLTGSGIVSSANYVVDTQIPTATVSLSDSALNSGETATLTVTFSEAVSGFTNADLTLANGTLSPVSSSNGGVTWTSTFTPTAGINVANNVITLNNTGVTDAVGNAGSGTTDSPNFTIDTRRPTATVSMSDSALKIGDSSTLTITFSQPVNWTDTYDTLSTPSLEQSGFMYRSNGGITWTGTFMPLASHTDTDNVISLNLSGFTSTATGLTGSGIVSSANYVVDTQIPTATVSLSDIALNSGETATLTVAFSEAVSDFTNADLTLASGTLSPVSSSDGGVTWTATFTPTPAITDATNVITLDNTGVTDAVGNAGSGTTDSPNFAVDTVSLTTPSPSPLPNPVSPDPTEVLARDANGTPLLSLNVGSLDGSVQTQSIEGNLRNPPPAFKAQIELMFRAVWAQIPYNTRPQDTDIADEYLNFFGLLNDRREYVLHNVRLEADSPAQDAGSPGTITFNGSTVDGPVQLLWIDVSELPAGTVLDLQNVSFAFVVGAERLTGGAGNNVVVASNTSGSFICLGPGDDELYGTNANDVVASREGNDQLFGNDGSDWIVGGVGNDTLEGGAGDDVLQGGASDAGTWRAHVNSAGQLVIGYAPQEAALGNTAAFSLSGGLAGFNTVLAADDRMAFQGLSAGRLETVALLYKAVTGNLPTLPELSHYASLSSSDADLARLAFDHFLSQQPKASNANIATQVRALITQVWGNSLATDSLVPVGVGFINAGGSWGEGLSWLAQHANGRAGLSNGQGGLNLAQPWRSGEMGWSADSGNDLLRGGDGDDRLIGGDGNDDLDGGSGIDTAVFGGTLALYTIRKQVTGDGEQWSLRGAGGEVDTLMNIERLSIGGKTYAMNEAFAVLPVDVDQSLAAVVVEVVGASAPTVDVIGW